MPRSKHRRQPGGKAVVRPGQGKPGKLPQAWLDEARVTAEKAETTAGLPPFDWAHENHDPRRRTPSGRHGRRGAHGAHTSPLRLRCVVL